MILNEGSRDNLLKPIIDLYTQKTGKQVSVSAMKQYILAKLVNEANIRNLSMDSNYYLAGAARYYANGDLTTNKVVNMFDESQTDVFNREICQRLNALILILRNSYIDSIGTTWEQPEDFGTLPIDKLLKKYNTVINKELGIVSKEKVKPEEEEVTNYNIGNNGYSFDILFSYEDAKKYNRYTEPGAWCITYGKQHFSNYCRTGNGHFVIFKKEGYENVKRKIDKSKWKGTKPQDDYGNSLIAYLQSNDGPMPADYWGAPLITSRWNHGWEEHCEADRAYTQDEFLATVGATEADMERIYKVWKKEKDKRRNENNNRKQLNAARTEVLRVLKYAQIKMNAGNRCPFDGQGHGLILSNFQKNQDLYQRYSDAYDEAKNRDASTEEMDAMAAKYSQERSRLWSASVRALETEVNGKTYYFLVDGNKILFETLTEQNGRYDEISDHFYGSPDVRKRDYDYHNKAYGFNNIVYCQVINGIMLYNTKKHAFVEIEGIKKFKYVPDMCAPMSCEKYIEIAMSHSQIALFNIDTNKPLVLPNGHCWCENIYTYTSWRGNNANFKAYGYREDWSNGITLVYDRAAREFYVFDLSSNKFLDLPANAMCEVKTGLSNGPIVVVNAVIRNRARDFVFKNGNPVEWNGVRGFTSVTRVGKQDEFYTFILGVDDTHNVIYDSGIDKMFELPEINNETYIHFSGSIGYLKHISIYKYRNYGYDESAYSWLWNSKTHELVKNPVTGSMNLNIVALMSNNPATDDITHIVLSNILGKGSREDYIEKCLNNHTKEGASLYTVLDYDSSKNEFVKPSKVYSLTESHIKEMVKEVIRRLNLL